MYATVFSFSITVDSCGRGEAETRVWRDDEGLHSLVIVFGRCLCRSWSVAFVRACFFVAAAATAVFSATDSHHHAAEGRSSSAVVLFNLLQGSTTPQAQLVDTTTNCIDLDYP